MKNIPTKLALAVILSVAFTLFSVFAYRNLGQSLKVYVNGDAGYRLYYQEMDSILTQDLAIKVKREADVPFTYGILPEHMQQQLFFTNVEMRAYQQARDVFPVQSGVVDLRENKVTVEGQDYFYTEENGRFDITEAEGDVSVYNLLQMIRLGHRDRSQNISDVTSMLLWHLWKPILFVSFGLVLLLERDKSANFVVKLFIKNAEPGDFFIGLVAFNGLILLGLALFTLYQIWISLPH